MVESVGHVAFGVEDLRATLEFYCGGLGLTEAFRLQDGDTLKNVYLRVAPGQFLEIFPGQPAGERGSAPSYRHLCLVVKDLTATLGALEQKGIRPQRPPLRGRLDKNWQVWIVDPDGNRIELMQIDPDSPQAQAG